MGGFIKKNNMKNVYVTLIKQESDYYLVYVPDIDANTEGFSFYDAIHMARDLIGMYSLDAELPTPSSVEGAIKIAKEKADDEEYTWSDGQIVYVDIDADVYKAKYDKRMVKKNCTIPAWLNDKATEKGINFSRVLQDALLVRLG